MLLKGFTNSFGVGWLYHCANNDMRASVAKASVLANAPYIGAAADIAIGQALEYALYATVYALPQSVLGVSIACSAGAMVGSFVGRYLAESSNQARTV